MSTRFIYPDKAGKAIWADYLKGEFRRNKLENTEVRVMRMWSKVTYNKNESIIYLMNIFYKPVSQTLFKI